MDRIQVLPGLLRKFLCDGNAVDKEHSSTDHDRVFKELITSFFVGFVQLFLPDCVTIPLSHSKPLDAQGGLAGATGGLDGTAGAVVM